MKTKYDEGVKALRNRLKLSQTELATELDLSVSLISKIESGDIEPSSKLLRKMKDKYGVDSDALSKGEVIMKEISMSRSDNPYRDYAIKQVEQERDYFKEKYTQVIDALLNGKLGKLLALKYADKPLRKVA